MKKLSIALLSVLLVFVATACSGGSSSQESAMPSSPQASADPSPTASGEPEIEKDASLVVWDNGDQEGDWTKYAAERFTAEYGVPVKVERVGFTDAPVKMQTDGPAGVGADVFAAPHDHVGSMVQMGLILENFYPDEYELDFMPAAVSGASTGGVLYGYPNSIDTFALYYNKDLVKTVPKTMDELVEQSKAFTDRGAGKFGFMIDQNFYWGYALFGGYGGYIFGNGNTDPNDIGLNNDGAVKAGQWLQKLHQEVLPLKAEDMPQDKISSLFNEGKLLFKWDGPWAEKAHRDAGINVGIAPLPQLDNGQYPATFSTVKGYYVSAYTNYPEAASLFAKFLTSKDMLLKRFEMTGQVPPRQDMTDAQQVKDNPSAASFLEAAQHAVPIPNIPEINAVWGPMGVAMVSMWNDGTDPQKALDTAVQQIRDAMNLKSE
ncbi:extracellular solute-binding protein [Paenibacillaceae bacterium WGS1546]|uniref:sugar ABC transporter substrate-binding protein n=1 Tax=Cohnella sp. WGS1546 TaxID=3366810 RepID=UPI00372CF2B9